MFRTLFAGVLMLAPGLVSAQDAAGNFTVSMVAPAFGPGLLGVLPGGDSADGVPVAAVVPESAADDAGLRPGDVIVSINGADLSSGGVESIHGLMLALKDVVPGDTVSLTFLRDGGLGQLQLVARAPSHEGVGLATARPGVVGPPEGGLPSAMTFGAAPAGGLRLHALDPELGRYFGVDSGVLVLSGGGMDGLRPGDVIQAVDGQVVVATHEVMQAMIGGGAPRELTVVRDGGINTVTVEPSTAQWYGGEARAVRLLDPSAVEAGHLQGGLLINSNP